MNLSGKKVFLSGPMTGMEHYNAPAFARAHAICKEHGAARVYDPAYEWLTEPQGESATKTHEDYMLACVNELVDTRPLLDDERRRPYYDVLVLLPDWSQSAGSCLEYDVARACGIDVVDLCDVEDGE